MRRVLGGLLAVALGGLGAPAQADSDSAWERFCETPTLTAKDGDAVERAARAYAHSERDLQALLRRGEPWFWHMLRAVRNRDMPAEIALLPAVESGFQMRAESGHSASGMWQLIPATARRFGLRVDEGLDQRLDVGHATRAALDYLDYLHGRFKSWPLALAAYNAGEGRVVRALRALGAKPGQIVSRERLSLPAETRRHYRRLLGLARLVCAPARFDVQLPGVPARALIAPLHLDRPASLAAIAETARLSREALARLNPIWQQARDTAPYRLWIPAHRVQVARNRLEAAGIARVVDFGAYRVRRGDTLSHIALRHGTSATQLRALNELPDTRIRVGMELRVPLHAGEAREAL